MRNYKAPLFQHRHYAAIAKVVADLRAEAYEQNGFTAINAGRLTDELITLFERDNGNFDAPRFRAAANGTPLNRKDAR